MTEALPERSAALAFWVKHQDAMQAFDEGDEENPAPPELQEIFDDEKYRPLLECIYNASIDDGNAVVHAIASKTAEAWVKHSSLVIERKRKASGWTEKFFVRRKRSRGGDKAEVGFYLEENPVLGVTLYAFLWTKGGKAAAEFNARCIREVSNNSVLKGTDDKTRYWSNGVVLLARLPLADFVSDDELEVPRFVDQAAAQIGRCTGDAVAKILESRR